MTTRTPRPSTARARSSTAWATGGRTTLPPAVPQCRQPAHQWSIRPDAGGYTAACRTCEYGDLLGAHANRSARHASGLGPRVRIGPRTVRIIYEDRTP